jgi:hypothetical protein
LARFLGVLLTPSPPHTQHTTHDANQELMDQLKSVFESLAEKEERQEHAKSVASVDITAYQCEKVSM